MSIFGAIMDKIFHHPAARAAQAPEASAAAAPVAAPTTAPAGADPQATAAAQPAAQAALVQPVDVGAVLTQMASQKGGGGNYQSSIVDLLKLLALDSSLDARKQLADELDCHVGAPGTAEENIALHKAVMQKLAENGGKVPVGMS
jgi:hypothetical protein